jgi:anion-transporting  ArsA/GET3 family ATPase
MRDLFPTHDTVICVGPGGVGKTTTAAALGVLGARTGRRTLVCTIDPAPRLADALGIANLGPDPQPIAGPMAHALGIAGEDRLLAMRVDTERAFSDLVREQVADPALRERILKNRLYGHIATDLTGSQEYAATLALHALKASRQYDLIILDTPPTANALEFLQTPERIAAAISSPAIRWFAKPDPGARRLSLGRLGIGGALLLRRAAKLMGSQFLDNLADFLLDIRSVLDGFLARAKVIERELRQPNVGFVLVLTAEVAAVNEALFFAEKLREAGNGLCAFIVNRALPPIHASSEHRLLEELAGLSGFGALTPDERQDAARVLSSLSDYLSRIAVSQQNELSRLRARAGKIPIHTVPLLPHDVSNLDSLRTVANQLERA